MVAASISLRRFEDKAAAETHRESLHIIHKDTKIETNPLLDKGRDVCKEESNESHHMFFL